MAEPDDILSYARKPTRLSALAHHLAWRHRRFYISRAGIYGFLPMLVYIVFHGWTSGQIRLDTGDLRYCWYGIPVYYEPMPEPERSKLLALAAGTPKIPAEWVTCVKYPRHTTANIDQMYRHFYENIAMSADEDPKIARWILDDLTDYERHMMSWGGPPRSCLIAGFGIDPHWRDNEEVKAYCAAHGYVPTARVVPPAEAP